MELKEFIHKTKGIFKEHGKWIFTVFTIGAYVMLVLFGILFFLSDSFEKIHHLYGVKKGFVLAIPLLALCISSYISGKNIKGNVKVMKGIILGCLAILTLCVPFVGFLKDQLVFLLCLTGFIGIAIGALLPTLDALITENIEKEERGTISSLYSSSRFIGVAAGPPLVSLVMKNGLNVSFIGAGLFAVIIIALVMFWIHTNDKKKPQPAEGSS